MVIKEKLSKFAIEITYPKKLPVKKPIANFIQSVNHWKLFFEIQNTLCPISPTWPTERGQNK